MFVCFLGVFGCAVLRKLHTFGCCIVCRVLCGRGGGGSRSGLTTVQVIQTPARGSAQIPGARFCGRATIYDMIGCDVM